MNRKRKINRKYMQMQTVGVFLLTLVVVLAVTWEINLNQVKREKLKASYTAECKHFLHLFSVNSSLRFTSIKKKVHITHIYPQFLIIFLSSQFHLHIQLNT